MAFSTSTVARWTILSSSAVTPAAIQPVPAFTLRPSDGIRMEVTKRSRSAEAAGPLGANETADRLLATSGPHPPSLSLAAFARHDLRQEPCAGNPLARIRAGGGQQWPSLPRLSLSLSISLPRSLDLHSRGQWWDALATLPIYGWAVPQHSSDGKDGSLCS